MFWFIVLLLVVGAGFYFYQKLISIEREIHAEQEAYSVAVEEAEKSPVDVPPAPVDAGSSLESIASENTEPTSLAEAILAEVLKQAGVKQTDLYPLFADVNKKQLQRLIKELADNGRLRREKVSSSYLLYPI